LVNSPKAFCLNLLGNPQLASATGAGITGRAVQRHRIAFLALLALAPGRALSRDKLIGLLWPESDTEAARKLLNQAVYHLRKTLGENAIVSTAEELRLEGDVVQCDVTLFEGALAEGNAAGAIELYRGPFMDGFFLSDAPEFDHWLDLQRQRLATLYGKALDKLAASANDRGDTAAALEWWQRRAAHDPFDSSVAVHVVEALDQQGNRAGALQYAEAHTRLLQEEFNIAPPAELQDLIDRLHREPERRSRVGEPVAHAPVEPVAMEVIEAQPLPSLTPPARLRYGYLVLAAALLGGGALFFLRRDDSQWLFRDALPRIESYLDAADWESAYQLAREAEKRVPQSPELEELWPRLAWRVTIHSDPEGATVFRQAYNARGDEWEVLGQTPLVNIRFPHGLSRIRLEREGYQPLVRALGGGHLNWSELRATDPDNLLAGPEVYKLETNRTIPTGMVRIAEWTYRSGRDKTAMRDFLLGRHEVTNAEYKSFVDAGGYQQPRFWDPVVIGVNRVPWQGAMKRFVDRTGRPGPATWEAGDYPPGQGEYPVSGVSWYEAAAYARFVRQELPTAHHWQEALPNALFTWLLPASNFSGQGARAVTQSRAMTHVGTFDMTGNVREWTSSRIGSQRVILGGSWRDPYYIAGLTDTSAPPEDRSATNGFRVAITHDDSAAARRVREPVMRTTTTYLSAAPPVSDAVYKAYSRVFDYDRVPLNPTVTASDTNRLWTRQRVQFSAGYSDERATLHLYLPRRGTPPYQVVVYWPGWDTFALDNADEYFARQIDFILKSGRAVAFPIYRGTFDRREGNQRSRPDFGSAAYRDNTIYTIKDLRRTVDYLQTRRDISRDRVAFFGYSWGGVNAPIALAQEPRLRVGIVEVGLLPPLAATPEVDPVNSLPRVRAPVLLMSGEFDAMVPRENAKRYFELLGTSDAHKRHVIAIGGHFIPRDLLIRETLDWLDKYLGEVK
jgi:eukaryotic-like serine/threonine-protein kinase